MQFNLLSTHLVACVNQATHLEAEIFSEITYEGAPFSHSAPLPPWSETQHTTEKKILLYVSFLGR